MKLKEWEQDRLMLFHAMLMAAYVDRWPPPGLDPYEVQRYGPDLVPAASKAVGRYLMDRRKEVLALDDGSIVEWLDAHQPAALSIGAWMQQIADQLEEKA